MNMRFPAILLSFLALFFFAVPQTNFADDRGIAVKNKLQQDSGKKIGSFRALVIGINDYEDDKIPDLQTAVNDAKSVAKVLRKSYGFTDITLLLDRQANGTNIMKSLRKIANSSKPEDSVLIYYAGHGDLDKLTKDGYWIPANATAQDPFTYIANGSVQQLVKAIPARHVLLVADSCFSGSLFGNARAMPSIIDDKYYANLFKEKSRWGMTSGNLTPVSDSGSSGHSVFAYQFLRSLAKNRKPFMTPREIYQDIAPIISNNSSQMPIAKPIRNTNDQGGEFLFIRTDALPEPVTAKQPTVMAGADTATLDVTFWNSIKDSNDPTLFQAYLDEFSDGTFVAIAQVRLKKLAKKEECCKLVVRSNVSGDMVYINGEKKRGTSKKPFKLSPGTYSIEVKKQGYNSWSQQVAVNESNTIAVLQARLMSKAPLPSSSPTVTEPEMVFVKGGCYQMGDIFNDHKNLWGGPNIEKPVHEVCVDDFYMGKYEITQKEWKAVMGSNPSLYHKGDYLPVVDISLNDVQDFLKKLNNGTGKNYSLPTEAEWEYACREEGKKVRFGTGKNTITSDDVNFDARKEEEEPYSRVGQYRKKITSVGSFMPNSLGLYDMSGNVFEWGLERYNQKDYSSHGRSNPRNTSDGEYHVLRGGSWTLSPYYSRCSSRNGREPDDKGFDIGFRVILRVSSETKVNTEQKQEPTKKRSSDGRYLDHGDGTITDTRTGLMWTKKDSNADTGRCKDWDASRSYVNSLATGGHSDWRMPTIAELRGIYDENKKVYSYEEGTGAPLHFDPIFTKSDTSYYWSSESIDSTRANYLDFTNGDVHGYYRDSCGSSGVRAVRSP